jgi:hypothetical protein
MLILVVQNTAPQLAAAAAIASVRVQVHSTHRHGSASGRLNQQVRCTTAQLKVCDQPSSLMQSQETMAPLGRTSEDPELLDQCHQRTHTGVADLALSLVRQAAAPCDGQRLQVCWILQPHSRCWQTRLHKELPQLEVQARLSVAHIRFVKANTRT